MRAAIAAVAALVVVGGCSSRGTVEGPGFANGTRLAARWDDLDGLRILRAFYDTRRGEECMFRVVPGGAACLPLSAQQNGWYADSGCTDELVEIPPVGAGRTAANALVVDPVDACSDAPTVRALGDPFPTADAWFRKSDGSCAHGTGGSRPATLRRIGDVVPLDQFVHATATVVQAGARIGAVVFVGDDGARLTAFGWDWSRSEWTAPALADDGTRRWWPVHLAFNYGQGTPGTPGTVYADDACMQATGVKEAHNALCPITAVVEFVPADACRQFTTRLHAAGDPVAPGDLHALAADGSCQPDSADANATDALYVTMGEVLPPDSFAPAGIVDVGTGRIVQHFDASPDGAAVLPQLGALFDKQRGVPCAVAEDADGVARCLPGGGNLDTVVYADAACLVRTFAMTKNVACTDDPVPPAEVTWNGRAYAVGAPLSPATLYQKNADGGCDAVSSSPDYDRWFTLGDEIPASAYQRATLHTE